MELEIEFECDEIDEVELKVEASASFHTDSKYNADADGNRGVSADFMEDFYLKMSVGTQDVTRLVKELSPSIYKKIKQDAVNQLEKEYEDGE